jgi:hypothetical protein
MINTWKVLWTEEGAHRKKTFESNSPSPAVSFGKDLKRRGLSVEIISGRKAFPPIKGQEPAKPGYLWCPYCVKWRDFSEAAIKDSSGLLGPVLLRCMVCTVSIRDAYIRKYNLLTYAKWEMSQERKRDAIRQKMDKKLSSVHKKKRS